MSTEERGWSQCGKQLGLWKIWLGSFLMPKECVCTFLLLKVKQDVDQKAGELPERLRVEGRDVGQGGV